MRTATASSAAAGLRRPGPSRPGLLLLLLLAVTLPATACSGGAADDPAPDAPVELEQELRRGIEEAYDFSRPGVLERMTSLYPATGRVVSASGGRVISSGDTLRAGIRDFWENVGSNMSDARWEWGEVHVERLGETSAVLTATWSIPHIAPTGRPHVISGAWTAVFRRIGGEWLIVQEHLSTPD
jgi:hypothetical protein